MIENLPGPDKGILDVLFSGKTPAQSQVPGEAQPTGQADFMKMLAQAQDQPATAEAKVNKVALELPKGEVKAAAKNEGQPIPVEEKKTAKKEETKVADPNQLQLQTQAGMKAQAAVMSQPETPVVIDKAKGKAAEAAAKGGQAKPDVKQTSQLAKAKTPVDASAQIESMTSVKPIESPRVTAQPSQPAKQVAVAEPVAPSVIQPIVIQVPMAVPMPMAMAFAGPEMFEGAWDVQGVESFSDRDRLAMSKADVAATSRPMVSSQEFMSRRGNILGVDRIDPRLSDPQTRAMAQFRGDSQELKAQERKAFGLRDDKDDGRAQDIGLVLPQVLTSKTAFTHTPVITEAAPRAVRQIDVSNPMMLASQVRGLASQGGGMIRVKIAPENLGEMTISVQSKGSNKIDVRFEASSHEAREALVNAVPELKNALAGANHDVGQIEVTRLSSPSTTSDIGGGVGMWVGSPSLSAYDFTQGSSSNPNNHEKSQHGNESGRGWNQFMERRDAERQFDDGRQRSGYRRYQEYELGA